MHLIWLGKKPVKLYYFFIWFLFTDSACYIRNNPTTIRPLTRYSIYRGNLVRMIFIGFLFHVKVMQKSDKNQTKSHGNIMQTCLHDICMKKMYHYYVINFFAWCSCNLVLVTNSYEIYAIFAYNYIKRIWKLNDKTK